MAYIEAHLSTSEHRQQGHAANRQAILHRTADEYAKMVLLQLQNSLYNSLRGLRKQKHLGST
jgi:hypothetical protein